MGMGSGGGSNISIDDFDYGINSRNHDYNDEENGNEWDIHCEPRVIPANVYPSPHRPKIQLHNRNTEDVITEIQAIQAIQEQEEIDNNNNNKNHLENSFHSVDTQNNNSNKNWKSSLYDRSQLQSILASSPGRMSRKPPVPSHIVPVRGKVFNEKVYSQAKDDFRHSEKIEMLNGSLLGQDVITLDQDHNHDYDQEHDDNSNNEENNRNRAIGRAIASEQINEFINSSSL